eukprot:CAMPEP_0172840014 /NCGR_PEP_ID=MMETSP1075-20121228/28985_1 /TAXON_ID=2916 /ORGANISM="Ceratium fusus, Strain PA161109" /LENGTH=341 /DNA_ID=CAMNT_0013683753 /DNA_START=67 /DNA_END=1089 /DNA_ORIENTATION=-
MVRLRHVQPLSQACTVRLANIHHRPNSNNLCTFSAIRPVFTQVPASALEMHQANELARKPPSEISSTDTRKALQLMRSLPKLLLPAQQLSIIGQQVLRLLLSYRNWYVPRVVRGDLPGNPLWSVGVPTPSGGPGGGQLLPLTSDADAFQRLTDGGVRGGADATVVKASISGVDAIREHLHGQGRWEGLTFNPGEEDEFVLDKDQLLQLHMWEATLRCEALMSLELGDSPEPTQPVSDELADLLLGQVKLCFVQLGQDLARDKDGHHIITLTSNDAAALCANAYGGKMVRPVTPQQLLTMADGAEGAFTGYALTLGPDVAPFSDAGGTHIPFWRTCNVPAEL